MDSSKSIDTPIAIATKLDLDEEGKIWNKSYIEE